MDETGTNVVIVNCSTWRLPAELDERPDRPPLTFLDILELHLLLLEPDWIDQLA